MTEIVALNVRKRQATRERIADCAAHLVTQRGLSGTTVESIAAAAEVGRATFFRYFSTKEDAVAEGITRHWHDAITAELARQPPQLSAWEAVVAAITGLGEGFDLISDRVRELETIARSSPVLSAWTLKIYVKFEAAIAEMVAPRYPDIRPNDPRPRLVGALAMASVRIALDDWLQCGGSLPDLVREALTALSVD